MPSEGFGIAGHKNSYSSKVRCGNWVEDEHGLHLASTKPQNQLSCVTESKHHFGPKRPEHTSAYSNAKKVIGMEGLSYGLLLNHRTDGQVHISPQTPYTTTHTQAFSNASFNQRCKPNLLKDQKLLEFKRHDGYGMYRTSSVHAQLAPFEPQATAKGKKNGERVGANMSFSRSFYEGLYIRR